MKQTVFGIDRYISKEGLACRGKFFPDFPMIFRRLFQDFFSFSMIFLVFPKPFLVYGATFNDFGLD
jgi:hypothetical protein